MPGNFPPPQPPLPGEDFDPDRATSENRSLGEVTGDLKLLWDFIAQFEQVEIIGADGRSYFVLAIDSGLNATAGSRPWSFVSVDGGIRLIPGTIIKDDSDITDLLTISNIDETIILVEGNTIGILVSEVNPDSCEIVSTDDWDGNPSLYDVEEDDDGLMQFLSHFHPLYQVHDAQSGDYEKGRVNSGSFFLEPLHSYSDFVINYKLYQDPTTKRRLSVPFLLPSNGGINTD